MKHLQQTRSSQQTTCGSPVRIALMPSTAPMAEKAQQEPHMPWFLTSLTAPSSRQSTAEGRLSASTSS